MLNTLNMSCDEAMCKAMPEMKCCKTGNSSTMSMQMWFEFSTNSTILFKFWKTTSTTSLVWSMVIIFFLAFSFEAIKFFRLYLNERALIVLKNNVGSGDYKTYQARMFSKSHCVQSVLHACQILVSYILMLIFMTYNGWLCIAVIVGEICGYFTFGWRKPVVSDLGGHCG